MERYTGTGGVPVTLVWQWAKVFAAGQAALVAWRAGINYPQVRYAIGLALAHRRLECLFALTELRDHPYTELALRTAWQGFFRVTFVPAQFAYG